MKLYKTFGGISAALAALVSAPAIAHPQLVSAAPAQSANVNHVDRIVLTFSEQLVAPLSGFAVVMTAMPGMVHGHQHQLMKVSGIKVSVGPDGKSLVGTMARRLSSGSYDVNWRAVSNDTHRITGKISFSVQ